MAKNNTVHNSDTAKTLTLTIEKRRYEALENELIKNGRTLEGELYTCYVKLYKSKVPAVLREHYDKTIPDIAATPDGVKGGASV